MLLLPTMVLLLLKLLQRTFIQNSVLCCTINYYFSAETWTLKDHPCATDYDWTKIEFKAGDHSRLECDPSTGMESMCGQNNLPGTKTTKGTSEPAG